MKHKKLLYAVLMAAGLVLLAAALLLRRLALSDNLNGAMVGVGSGLFAMGLANRLMLRWEEKDPVGMKRSEIEANDERTVAIRRRAKAVSGDVLQWAVMAAAWGSIALGAPLWITLLAVGVFILKSALDMALMARYQKEM